MTTELLESQHKLFLEAARRRLMVWRLPLKLGLGSRFALTGARLKASLPSEPCLN